ncbi:hypothetical protein [Sinimarinibacterium sp. NLF-5-8]|uniref:hypothetical protein n=1 Tax=Sinimarinibacterium sp. NLF-5-8 TaxID=2698684 RepID=UPI00137BFE75|nr:hypothetical protein [Sinimarinibacterium sp. NLF-5-8]QHS08777.1 hypothetical protein GT972_00570 [Sinimarinibacterium sp. NLF-5-8]
MTLQTFATAQRFRVARALRGERQSLHDKFARMEAEREADLEHRVKMRLLDMEIEECEARIKLLQQKNAQPAS